jgi:exonuclease SbcC
LEKQVQQLQYLHEQSAGMEEELKQREGRWQDLHSEMGQLSAKRLELFGIRNPDEEESFLKQAIEKSEQKQGEAQQKLNAVNQELYSLQSRLQGLEKSTVKRAGELKQAEGKFQQALVAHDFNNETEYQAALLSNEKRERLLQRERELTKEKNSLEGRLQDKKTALAKEREKNLTEQPLNQLQEQCSELAAKYDELQQEIGAIRQKLRENQLLRQQQAERLKAIELQKVECAKWGKLNLLIGSADGKKYRSFAQGLTFDMVLAHANRHLQKMTDRYLLIRDEKQALDMNIIDNYQAGEVRSVKNLSGGESFIVSLSLALGLSGMASRNVRVDSLFLDEGFGSLDEEALDQALETLAGLRQEGKLIGLISHVGALKERISTQIQLIPQSGGNSIILI